MDTCELYDTLTTLHDAIEYRLPYTVQSLRDSFESGEFENLRSAPVGQNARDVLTKTQSIVTKTIRHYG